MIKNRVVYKYIRSYFARNWSVKDYPLRIYEQEAEAGQPRFVAQIINWFTAIGLGYTPEEALDNLQAFLNSYRAQYGKLPRPGTKAPLRFATNERIRENGDLLELFICKVLDIEDGTPILITDESSLSDFCELVKDETMESRLQAVFGVDVSHMMGGKVIDVFEYIRQES
jgi:hypothetical protein